MAENIHYQINGLLADNTVTVDDTEDKILVPVSLGTADEARILAEMEAEESGLCPETIQHVYELEKRIVKRLLLSGYRVNNGLYYASVAFRGLIQDARWDETKNSVVANLYVGAELRDALRQTRVNIIGEKSSAMYIAGTTDTATRAQDATATAGRAFTLTGSRLRVAGTDASVGIVLIAADGMVTRVTADFLVINNSSKVVFLVPAWLPEGTYTLRLTTQFSGHTKILLKKPRSVEKTIHISTLPPGRCCLPAVTPACPRLDTLLFR